MNKILIVAEKPSAGKDIARILGVTEAQNGYMENDKYIVTWARGHLIGLKDPDENNPKYQKWDVDDLPLPYDNGLKVLTGARDQYKIVKNLIQRDDISYLINAGDAGREGLLIQSWIYRMCGNRHPVKILWASSLTDEAILSAME
ncbi:MAG: toprim domain-containing protein, partial [Clostridiales bacterium]|nr:toprim domain-containing protein [Clostridiales bacterium]